MHDLSSKHILTNLDCNEYLDLSFNFAKIILNQCIQEKTPHDVYILISILKVIGTLYSFRFTIFMLLPLIFYVLTFMFLKRPEKAENFES